MNDSVIILNQLDEEPSEKPLAGRKLIQVTYRKVHLHTYKYLPI